MITFPINLESDEGHGWVVTVPGVPEIVTQGDSHKECYAMARDALYSAFDFYLEDFRHFPEPKQQLADGQHGVAMGTSFELRIKLHNLMVENNINVFKLTMLVNSVDSLDYNPQIVIDACDVVNLLDPSKSFDLALYDRAILSFEYAETAGECEQETE